MTRDARATHGGEGDGEGGGEGGGVLEGAPGGVGGGVLEGAPGGVGGGVLEGAPGGAGGGVLEGAPGSAGGGVLEGAPGSAGGGVLEGAPGGAGGSVLEGAPGSAGGGAVGRARAGGVASAANAPGAEDERLGRVVLSMLARPGSRLIATLVAESGVEGALASVAAELAKRGLALPPMLDAIDCLARAEREGVRFVTPIDDEWPSRLEGLERPAFGDERGVGGAVGLWVLGGLALDEAVERSVGIVGSRAPTDYGVRLAMEFAHDLAERGFTVISGAAYGIDAAAHRGALAVGGRTVAVLAGGVNVRYPSGNAGLLERIADEGLLVSEVPWGMAATRERFLVRNRLIAALSTGTVLVEAGLRSGARNTVSHARALNRHVMAVPGQVTSAMSVGSHLELRRPGTVLVTCASDVLETLAAVGEHLPAPLTAPVGPRDGLSQLEALVLDATPVRSARPSSRIAATAGVNVIEAGMALVRLQAAGLVVRAEGGWRLTPVAKAPKATLGVPVEVASAAPGGASRDQLPLTDPSAG